GGVVADVANSTIQALASVFSKEFNPAKAIRNEDLIRNYQTQASQKLSNLLYGGFGKCDQSPAACRALHELLPQMGRPSQLDPEMTFNQLGAQFPTNIPQSMRVAADGFLRYDAQAQASSAMNQCLDLTLYAIQPDRQALQQESAPQVGSGFIPVV